MPGFLCNDGANHRPLTGAYRCAFPAFGYQRGQARRGCEANSISYQCARRYGHDHVAISTTRIPSATTLYEEALRPHMLQRQRSVPPVLDVTITHNDPWRRQRPITAEMTYGELRANRIVRSQHEIPAMY